MNFLKCSAVPPYEANHHDLGMMAFQEPSIKNARATIKFPTRLNWFWL